MSKLPINWELIMNPVNWIVILLMVSIAAIALHIFLPNVNVPGVTSHSLSNS